MATKKELFVVTATEFSYNDETYNTEGDGGQPLSAFFDRKEAEAFVTKSTAEWIKVMGADNLASHGYGIDEIFSKAPSFLSQKEQEVFLDDDNDTLTVIESLNIDERSDEELATIASALTFSPFTIHKVTVE
ncbi:MAG: hypothetical protein JW384_02007 [Nitrosomonadaceae bacterium]|nr:hypothetical protein [Nitrosomonadaceae bacterium]